MGASEEHRGATQCKSQSPKPVGFGELKPKLAVSHDHGRNLQPTDNSFVWDDRGHPLVRMDASAFACGQF